jgi:hypothetical protein
MPVDKRQKLHELGGATTRPHIRRELGAADGDAEPPEQVDADAVVLGFRGNGVADPSHTLHEERFGNDSRSRSLEVKFEEDVMNATSRADAPVAIEGDGVELRMQSLGGGMTTAFVRVPKGADFRPALAGLPDDLCQCPHWGYLLKGRVKMHTRHGDEVYEAGQAFYWAPGHAPEALEDSEYVDFSPTDEFCHVIDHIKAKG